MAAPEMSCDLAEQVCLVTGASRGIGFEIARRFLAQGAKVAICARKEAGLGEAAERLGGGHRLLAVKAHVAVEEDVKSMFSQVLERFGRLDVLVNNAGMNLFVPAVTEAGFSLWQKIMESNLNGMFLCSQAAAAVMKEQRQGKIISISSLAARQVAPGMGIYGVAKAAMEMLTKVLAAELAFYNIQVNAVAPGMVRTGFSQPFWSNEDVCRQIVNAIPAGRLAEPRDVADLVLFLASPAADYLTGQIILLDGGASLV